MKSPTMAPSAANQKGDASRPLAPKTATEEPGFTPAVLITEPTPVVTAQPMRAATADGTLSERGTQLSCGTTAWSAKQEKCWNRFLEDIDKEDDDDTKKYILKRALNKEYHDFESEDSKFAMESDFCLAGYEKMRKKCIDGKYDF